jgi:hypothetical protein
MTSGYPSPFTSPAEATVTPSQSPALAPVIVISVLLEIANEFVAERRMKASVERPIALLRRNDPRMRAAWTGFMGDCLLFNSGRTRGDPLVQ